MPRPVTIYTTTRCGYCVHAKRLLEERQIPYDEIDLTGDAKRRAWLVAETGGRRTVPQIFICGQPIGGYQELRKLDQSGELSELVAGCS